MKAVKIYEKNKQLIETIINNKSCSNVSISFREDIKTLAVANGIKYCSSCNTGLFYAVYHLHNLYRIEKEKKQNKNVKRNENTEV